MPTDDDLDLEAAWLQLSDAVRACVSPRATVASTPCLPLYTLVYALCSPTAGPAGESAPPSRAPALYARLRALLFLHARAAADLLTRVLPPPPFPRTRHPLFSAGALPHFERNSVQREAARLHDTLPPGYDPLVAYAALWDAYSAGIDRVATIFCHLDNDYIAENNRSVQSASEFPDDGDMCPALPSVPVFDVRSTALIAWRDEVIALVGPVLLELALDITATERRARVRGENLRESTDKKLPLIRVLLNSVVSVGTTTLLEVHDESSSACSDASSGDPGSTPSNGVDPRTPPLDLNLFSFTGIPPSPHLNVCTRAAYSGLAEASQPPDPLRLTDEKREPCVLFFYRQLFQRPFLIDVERFYSKQSALMLDVDSVSVRDYVQKMATLQLENEINFAAKFVHSSTLDPLRATLEQELIAEHKPRLLDAAGRLLRDACCMNLSDLQRKGVIDDLHNLYRLLVCVPDGVRPLQDLLRRHAMLAGTNSLHEFSSHDGNLEDLLAGCAGDAPQPTPATKFVHGAWDVFHRFQTITEVSFEKNDGCQNALNQACERFINSVDAAPQLLAQFTHEILEETDIFVSKTGVDSHSEDTSRAVNGHSLDEEAEEWVTRTTRLFRYLSEKDVFQRVYAIRLTRRLIYGTSRSLNAEHFMLAQLGELCGPDYTARLKRMFSDVDASRVATSDFRRAQIGREDHPRKHPAFDFQVLVLSSTAWPVADAGGSPGSSGGDTEVGPDDSAPTLAGVLQSLNRSQSTGHGGQAGAVSAARMQREAAAFVALPGRIGVTCAQFMQHYTEAQGHSRRRLTWMYHLCRVGLRAYLGPPNRRREQDLEVTLVQAAVLLQFNDQACASIGALSATLGVARSTIAPAVELLVRVGLLVYCGRYSSDSNDALVEVNEYAEPVSGTLRVALLSPERREQKGLEKAKKFVEKDRRTQIQACVVRKMKEANILEGKELFKRVTAELRRWFPVAYADIVRNVETLIENEYIARDGTVYSYVA